MATKKSSKKTVKKTPARKTAVHHKKHVSIFEKHQSLKWLLPVFIVAALLFLFVH